MREASSIAISKQLIGKKAKVIAYYLVAIENAKKVLPKDVVYTYRSKI
jgi:UDPglucose 6-dehydrogenase